MGATYLSQLVGVSVHTFDDVCRWRRYSERLSFGIVDSGQCHQYHVNVSRPPQGGLRYNYGVAKI